MVDLPDKTLPKIHAVHAREEGDRHVEEVDLEFANGERRRYRRVLSRGPGSVIIAAMVDADTVLLKVEQVGGIACHTGRESCFFRKLKDGQWTGTDPVLKDPVLIYGKR